MAIQEVIVYQNPLTAFFWHMLMSGDLLKLIVAVLVASAFTWLISHGITGLRTKIAAWRKKSVNVVLPKLGQRRQRVSAVVFVVTLMISLYVVF